MNLIRSVLATRTTLATDGTQRPATGYEIAQTYGCRRCRCRRGAVAHTRAETGVTLDQDESRIAGEAKEDQTHIIMHSSPGRTSEAARTGGRRIVGLAESRMGLTTTGRASSLRPRTDTTAAYASPIT